MHGIYQIKALIRQRSTVFWSLVFPLFLSAVFYFMFGGIAEKEMFNEIPVGIVHSDEYNKEFVEVIKSATLDSGKNMFAVTEYTSMDEAQNDLKAKDIKGILDLDNDYDIITAESSIQATMLKTFVEQYEQYEMLVKDVAANHPELLPGLLENMNSDISREMTMTQINLKGQDKDCFSQYFYSVIAMTCLSACMMGVTIGTNVLPNCSTLGARRSVAPTTKLRQIVTDFLASFALYDAMSLVILFVLIFVFKRDFGSNLPLVILTTFIGNFCGLAIGLYIAVITKCNKNTKQSICVVFYMISSFLAGLQWADITYRLERSCPIVNRINPATLIVNSFKSLAVFGDYNKFLTNILTLCIIGIIFLMLSVFKMRRTRYASL